MPVVALVGGTLGGEPIRIDVGCDRASTDLTRSCNLQRPDQPPLSGPGAMLV